MFCKVARAFGAPHDIMEVDGEVEGEAEACGVRCGQSCERVLVRRLVSLEGRLPKVFLRVEAGEFGEVPVIISSPSCAVK